MCIPKKQLKMDEINETGNENSISIVLPMYNEEENAHKIVTNLKKWILWIKYVLVMLLHKILKILKT